MNFSGKKIAVGITGGIAAYKTCELIREIKKTGGEVRVAVTKSALEFVTELTLATLSENPVQKTLFGENEIQGTVHLDLARWCDLLVVCPATANTIAKVASGLADDFLTTTILATKADVVFCPAMNSAMLEKQVVQDNFVKIRSLGYKIIEPQFGALATTTEGEGWGRLPEISTIAEQIDDILLISEELKNKTVLVTAGPSREPLDPVRFISNYSSGKMGFALAREAKRRGAEVILVAGQNNLIKPDGIRYVEVDSAEEMLNAIEAEYKSVDILLMAAAVADYKAKVVSGKKIKKKASALSLELVKTVDILAELGKKKDDRFHLGFALETHDGVKNATQKLHKKNLDMIVLNNPLHPGGAFGGDTNIVSILSASGNIKKLNKLLKSEVAKEIFDELGAALKSKNENILANG